MIFQGIISSRVFMIFLIPFLLGLISVLSFQPFNLTFINFFIFPSLFFVLTFVNKRSRNIYRKKPFLRNLFFVGHSFGVGFFISCTYWISNSLTFDESFKLLIPFAIFVLPVFLGLFFGFGTLAIGPFLKNNLNSLILFSLTFSLIDFIRGKILTGFPWNLWAYSWSWFEEAIQILSIIGLYAFNFLTITLFLFPALFFLNKKKIAYLIAASLILIFFSNYIYGSIQINNKKDNYISDTITKNQKAIKIISPNFDLRYDLNLEEIGINIDKLIKFSAPEKDKKTIFVWPEGVFSGYNFDEIKIFKNKFNKNFNKNHLIIFGINKKNEKNIFNSFVMINNEFEILYQYNKRKLVPFGEFLPFESLIKKIGFKTITRGYSSFTPGKNLKTLDIDNYKILPLICYEIIFPELIQKIDKTNLIINLSEDAWFGKSIGPYQHFSKSIFRAIENNSYLIRATNQGISAFINHKGQVVKFLKPNEAGNIELNVPIVDNKNKNKNDLIFFILLFTYISFFFLLKKYEK